MRRFFSFVAITTAAACAKGYDPDGAPTYPNPCEPLMHDGMALDGPVPEPEVTRGRYANGPRLCSPSGSCVWALLPTADRTVRDGFGEPIGTLSDPLCVRYPDPETGTEKRVCEGVHLNQGQRKVINGMPHVMVWRAPTQARRLITGWIAEGGVIDDANFLSYELRRPDPGGATSTPVTPMDPRGARGGDPGIRGGLADETVRGAEHEGPVRESVAMHAESAYVIPLLYSTPGCGALAADVFAYGGLMAAQFVRSSEVAPVVRTLRDGRELVFVYGSVSDGTQTRFGWIAEAALTGLHPDSGEDEGDGI